MVKLKKKEKKAEPKPTKAAKKVEELEARVEIIEYALSNRLNIPMSEIAQELRGEFSEPE